MIFKSAAVLLLLDLEHKIKEDEFSGALKASVEAFQAAQEDFQNQKYDAALAKLRPILAKPTGAEDRKIILTRYDRQLGRQISVGEHEYYPYQLAARCLQLSAKAEPDKARAMEMLKEAKGYLDASIGKCQADSSKAFLRQVSDAISRLEGEVEPAGPTPAEIAAKQIRKLIESSDYVAASAAIDKTRDALGAQAAALKEELDKAQKKTLGLKWADAEEYLARFKATRKIDSLVEELRALIPSKVTALSPEFLWIKDFAEALSEHRAEGTVENARSDPAEGFVARAMDLEQFGLVKAAAEVRCEHAAGLVRRAMAAAKSASLKEMGERAKAAQDVVAKLKREREAVEGMKEKFPARRGILDRYGELLTEKIQALQVMAADLPKRSAAVDEVIEALGRADASVFGPEAGGSYEALYSKLMRALESADFVKCHKEVQAAGHYLAAVLTALEGFRRGDAASEIRKSVEPLLKKARDLVPSIHVDLPLSPKVKSLLIK
jgi:hypothetical protein